MEEYHRDSLREMRREFEAKPIKKRGNLWITLFIILLFLFAGSFFIATHNNFQLEDAKSTIEKWSKNIASTFNSEKNDITETVDAVLAEQNAKIQ